MHIFCGEKSRGDCCVEKDMLPILDIVSITQVTGGGFYVEVSVLKRRA
jgi:hypothetical protein